MNNIVQELQTIIAERPVLTEELVSELGRVFLSAIEKSKTEGWRMPKPSPEVAGIMPVEMFCDPNGAVQSFLLLQEKWPDLFRELIEIPGLKEAFADLVQ